MVDDISVKEIILNVVKKIKEHYAPEKIVLYGSFAYGKPDEDSDIDLLIIKDTRERPIDRRVYVRRVVSNLRKGHPFSSIVVTPQELKERLEIGDQFFKEILLKGKVLYAK